MKGIKPYIFTVLFLVALSCTERIEIPLDEGFIRLVVEGNITTDTTAHLVKLSKTSDYFYNLPPEYVTGASVTISDNGVPHTLAELEPGHYYTGIDFHGLPGHTYVLNIRLVEAVGGYTEYTAESFMNPVSPVDSIGLLFHPDWGDEGIWEVQCYIQDPPSADYYRFLISRNKELITDTLREWFVTDDKFFNGSYIRGASIGFLDQASPLEELQPGDTVTAEINSIGMGYATFIQEAQSELFGSNPLFSGPPANVKGNLINGAFGFFAAYSLTRAVRIVPGYRWNEFKVLRYTST
jgi:hypothetical protein